jgi:hypothetical protein
LRSAYSSVKWTVSFGGDPTFVDQTNSQWLDISVPDGATQIALRTSCTLEAAKMGVAVVNYCAYTTVTVTNPYQGSIPFQPYTGQYFMTYSDFPRLSFESADGRVVCARSIYNSGNTQCGASFTLNANGVSGFDQFEVRCDDPV